MLLIKNRRLRQMAGLIETANILLVKLAIKKPTSVRMFPNRIFREYMNLAEKDKWICKDMFDIIEIANGTRIELEHVSGSGSKKPIDELAYLAFITKVLNPKNIFEIGTYRGRTALNFALNSSNGCTVWTLDLPFSERDDGALGFEQLTSADRKLVENSDTGVDYKGKDCEGKIRQMYGNSLSFDFSPYYNNMDLVFIDGAHYYEAAKSDTLNGLKMLNSGGFLVWHDFANYGAYNDVTRAVLDVLPGKEVIQISNTQLAIYKKTKG